MTGPAARWDVVLLDQIRQRVWIIDLDGARSITNDAEAVCAKLHAILPGYRVLYRDTMGNWDELVIEHGRFVRFAPARELAKREGIT